MDGVNEAVENEVKKQQEGFFGILPATSISSLLGNVLGSKGVIRAGEGTVRASEGAIRADQDF